jgi:hypothetical protein
MALENSIQSAVSHTAFAVFDDDTQVVILNRKVVGIEFERTTHGIKLCGLQSFLYQRFVF